jgi:tetratricopeptide (TPR) repeat protein/cellulose biosynthesis protein BcsQ
MSRIITFYSYKGGVGRTFALANIAVLLAQRGKRVLAMDWDLEAPGLHRYFQPYYSPNSYSKQGLIYLLNQAAASPEADWRSHVTEVRIEHTMQLSLISSGDQNPDYVDHVRSFSWSTFFELQQGGAILDRWRAEWKQEFDFILLDSRTGITDVGGVCTILLPDFLVLVFVANEQSFERGKQIALGVQKARQELAVQRPPLTIFPLLGRFDGREEFDEGQRWLDRFATELKPFYDDWLPTRFNARQVLELTKVPYITKFSFGEPLPVISHGVRDPDGPGFYLDKVAEILVSDFNEVSKILAPNESESIHLPNIWNVPYNRNPYFIGREQLLENIRASLTSGQPTALTQVALYGLGGVGKTQLALEYAYRHSVDRQDYDLVWWARAESLAALAADYAALAMPLGLPEIGATEQEVAVAAVRQHLGQRRKWLLIFDNAADPEDLKNYLPRGGGGHILITSRYASWRGVARPLDVRVLSRPESVAFLLKGSGREETAAAAELAQELGDLPLALEQARAYIEECGCSIGHYLDLFRTRYKEMLRRGKSSQEYPDTVATTWELSFQKVKAASPSAADLLNLCAYLAPDDIPKKLLVEGAKHLPKSLAAAVQDPVACNDALAVLRRYSLMEVSNDALAVHRLVQAVVRDRLNKKEKKQWAGAAVEMVNEVFPRDIVAKVETWPWCARLLPHGQVSAAHAQELKAALPATASIFNAIGAYLNIRAEYEAAKQALEGALAIGEAIYKPDNPKIATYANNLGYVLQTLGDLEGARAHYERALAIMEKVHGPNHPQVAIAVNNLGSVLRALGDLAEARVHYERALAIDEAAYGPDHPEVAIDVSNLGGVLRDLEDLEGAKAHYERALAIMEKVHGPNHPHVATAANNLGGVLQALGDLVGARAHYEQALAIDEAAYGSNHPQVAIRVSNLGSVLQALGDLPGAKACLERALAIRRQFLGEDHPKTKIVRDNLAVLGLASDE